MGTSGSGEMDITSQEVLEELKCPVCVEYMTPPIPMCQNGHNICNTCRQKVNQCAICKEEFLKSRCWLLENIIRKIKIRCQYYKEGCQFVSTCQFINSHEADCPDRPFNCPLSVVGTTNFCWRGHVSRMWDHILCKHPDLAVPKAAKFVLTVDSTRPGTMYRALSACGETFFLLFRVINLDLYCCVLYVGPQERASLYKYWVTAEPRHASECSTVCLPTKSYFADVETLFRNRECAVFSYAFWNRGRRALPSNMFDLDIQCQVMGVLAFMQHMYSVGILA